MVDVSKIEEMTVDEVRRLVRSRLELLRALDEHERACRRAIRKCAEDIAADGAVEKMLVGLGFICDSRGRDHDVYSNADVSVWIPRNTTDADWINRVHLALDTALMNARVG